jgi:hypothetical protein
LFGEGVFERLVDKLGERARVGFAGLVHGVRLCEAFRP